MDYSDSPVGIRNDSKSGLEQELTELKELVRELLKENDTPLLDRGNLVSILQKLKQKVQPDPANNK